MLVMSFVHGATGVRFAHGVGTVPSGDVQISGVFFQRQREGATDEAGAQDGDAPD